MSSDPLTALRRCIRDHKAQAHDPTTREITLDTEKFPADTPTRFRNKMGDPYSLGALWFFYITYVSNGVQHQQFVFLTLTDTFLIHHLVSNYDRQGHTGFFFLFFFLFLLIFFELLRRGSISSPKLFFIVL
jgi:hypothetical protein